MLNVRNMTWKFQIYLVYPAEAHSTIQLQSARDTESLPHWNPSWDLNPCLKWEKVEDISSNIMSFTDCQNQVGEWSTTVVLLVLLGRSS